jgi:hypothetical protein
VLQDILDEAVDHEGGRILGRKSTLPAVSEIFEVVASNTAEEFFASMYGTVCAPQP